MKAASNLEKILTGGHFAVTGEMGPPKSANGDVIRHKAGLLKGHVDAVNITDNQTAIVRMSSISVGTMLVQLGIEPTIQMTCRIGTAWRSSRICWVRQPWEFATCCV